MASITSLCVYVTTAIFICTPAGNTCNHHVLHIVQSTSLMCHFTIHHLTQPYVIIITQQMLGWKGLPSEYVRPFYGPLEKILMVKK